MDLEKDMRQSGQRVLVAGSGGIWSTEKGLCLMIKFHDHGSSVSEYLLKCEAAWMSPR